MNKSDLIEEAVKRSGLTRRDASRGVEAALDTIKRELGSAHIVHIRGLGRLHFETEAARLSASDVRRLLETNSRWLGRQIETNSNCGRQP